MLRVNLPAEIVEFLGQENLDQEVRKRLAVALYAEKKVSLGDGAQLAGIPYADFMKLLGQFGMYIHYGIQDLQEDIKTLKKLGLLEMETSDVLTVGRRRFRIVIQHDAEEDCWVTCVPALNHLSDWGETREEVVEHTREAVTGYLETLEKAGLPLPGESV